jgi:hypothetical protein
MLVTSHSRSQYLLLIACSQRKHSASGLLPALQRYDGGNYRLLRKARREGYWPENLEVLILSAKYGLIESSTPIENYEQRMDQTRADELRQQTLQSLQDYARQDTYHEVYVELGQDYFLAVGDLSEIFKGSTVIYGSGRIGERLANLKQWIKRIYQAEKAIVAEMK